MADDPTSFVVEVDNEVETSTVIEALESQGGRVRHRYGKLLLVDLPATAEVTFRRRLPARARLLSGRELEARPAPIGETLEALGLAAALLRQSQEFRRSKESRRMEGREWGSADLPEPDVGDDMGDADQERVAHRPPEGEP